MGIGPSIFFPLTAVQSVPFLIVAICLAIRGLITAPEKKSLFIGLLTFYGIYVAVFFLPVVNYSWMYSETMYDGLYHSLGFLLSIVILIVALSTASSNFVKWRGLFPKVYFSCWGFQLLLIAVPAGGGGMFGSSPTMLSWLFYGIYALAQIVVPLLAASSVQKRKGQLIAERLALIEATQRARQYYQQPYGQPIAPANPNAQTMCAPPPSKQK